MTKILQMPSTHTHGSHNPHTVVWHAMGQYIDDRGTVYHAKSWLDQIKYGAHYLVDPDGLVFQLCDPRLIIYHAGGHNTNKIGVELLVKGVWYNDTFLQRIKNPYHTGDQYASAVWLQKYLDGQLGDLKMVTHEEIDKRIDKKGNKVKQDPGAGFPFETFKSDCKI